MPGKNKTGRPSVMTDNVLRKLEHGFSCGMSDREACLYANIGESTLYDYCKQHPEFSERKAALKNMPAIKAKFVICEAIERGEVKVAQWYLERKCKEEFSLRQETNLPNYQPVVIVEDVPRE